MPNKIQGAVERLTADLNETCPPGSKHTYALVRKDDLRTLLALHQQQAASTCEGEWVAIPRKALEPFRLACERYFHTQRHFEITGSTSAERGFSEGERDDTAIELAVSDLRGEHFVELGLALSAAPSSGIAGEKDSSGADIARTGTLPVLTSAQCKSDGWSAAHVLGQLSGFLADLATADLDEIAADGGVTVGMVFQQQARDVYGPRVRAALSSEAPIPKTEGEGA